MQQDIERKALAKRPDLLSQFEIGRQAGRFVEHDKINIIDILDQLILALADNPGDPGRWPVVLQCSQSG